MNAQHRIHIAFTRSAGPYWGYVKSWTPAEVQTVHGDTMEEVRGHLLAQLIKLGARGMVTESYGIELA